MDLLNKSQKYDNFSSTMSFTQNNSTMNVSYKQNKNLISYLMSGSSINVEAYMDIDKDIAILTMMNYAMKTKISELAKEYSVDSLANPSKQVLDEIDNYNYTYIDKIKYHNKTCVHFKLEMKKDSKNVSNENYYNAEYYVDSKTGTVERIIGFDKDNKQIIDLEINTVINSVKDGEIKEPDLSTKQMLN